VPKHYTRFEINRTFKELENTNQDFLHAVSKFLDGLYRYYFRVGVRGWKNVPEEKALFVGNHNGLITFEVPMLFHAWQKKFGKKKKAVGLAHDLAVHHPLLSWLLPRMGAIPAHPEMGMEAFKRAYSVLVFPGGLKEAYRSYKDKDKIDFFQRKGFIRLARNAGVPIVPVVSVGAHETYHILDRGEGLAKKLGLKEKYRLDGVPITYRGIFFALCVSSGLLTFFPLLLAPAAFAAIFIPMPAKMDFRILPAVNIQDYWDDSLSENQNLQNVYDEIMARMQRAVRRDYKKRKLPILG